MVPTCSRSEFPPIRGGKAGGAAGSWPLTEIWGPGDLRISSHRSYPFRAHVRRLQPRVLSLARSIAVSILQRELKCWQCLHNSL